MFQYHVLWGRHNPLILIGYFQLKKGDLPMDVIKIGEFLATLRKEQGWTQEQLGERLGVTNKTVSRWEKGNYLPPVEMLQMMSDLYGLSINEILSGERLTQEQYRERAEENIKTALSESAFTLQEKIEFYKTKWKKEHRFDLFLGLAVVILLYVAGVFWDSIFYAAALAVTVGYPAWYRNAMMAYVEDRAFDGSGRQ